MDYEKIDTSKMNHCQRQVVAQAKTIKAMREENEKLLEQLGYANSCVVALKSNILDGKTGALEQVATYMNRYIYIKVRE